MPRPDLPDVQLRAMRELVKQLKKRKRAATERPRGPDLVKEAGAAAGTEEPAPAREHTADTAPARGDGNDSANTAPARERTTGAAPARYIGRDRLGAHGFLISLAHAVPEL